MIVAGWGVQETSKAAKIASIEEKATTNIVTLVERCGLLRFSEKIPAIKNKIMNVKSQE